MEYETQKILYLGLVNAASVVMAPLIFWPNFGWGKWGLNGLGTQPYRNILLLVSGTLVTLAVLAAPITGGSIVIPYVTILVMHFFIIGRIVAYFINLFRPSRQKQAIASDTGYSRDDPNEGLRRYEPESPRHTFKDVVGMQEMKDLLIDAATKFTAGIGKKEKKEAPNGILLHGEPGNGKTFIAEALAGELGYRFLLVTQGDFASRWVNQTVEQIRLMFDDIRRMQRVVLFFDEIDTLIPDRDGMDPSGTTQKADMVTTMMKGVENLRGSSILVMGATNFKDRLDDAAIRPGRFDFHVTVPPPDAPARRHLLQAFLPKGLSYTSEVLDTVVGRWEGFSLIMLKSVVREAADSVRKTGGALVTSKDMFTALRKVQGSMGGRLPENTPRLKDLSFSDEMRERLNGLANRMKHVAEIERRGGTIPKGVLFYGPPGTGKTAVAKALALDSEWAFLSLSGQDMLHDADLLDETVKKAKTLRPCIIFIDEADDILRDRGSNPYGTTSTNKLLQVMDGVTALPDVMFIAATNHPDVLDGAAVRGGRFGEQYEFERPGEDVVLAVVRAWMQGSKAPFSPEFTAEAAARLLAGFAPADIRDRLQQAVNRVVSRMDDSRVTLKDLQGVVSPDSQPSETAFTAKKRSGAKPRPAPMENPPAQYLEAYDALSLALSAWWHAAEPEYSCVEALELHDHLAEKLGKSPFLMEGYWHEIADSVRRLGAKNPHDSAFLLVKPPSMQSPLNIPLDVPPNVQGFIAFWTQKAGHSPSSLSTMPYEEFKTKLLRAVWIHSVYANLRTDPVDPYAYSLADSVLYHQYGGNGIDEVTVDGNLEDAGHSTFALSNFFGGTPGPEGYVRAELARQLEGALAPRSIHELPDPVMLDMLPRKTVDFIEKWAAHPVTDEEFQWAAESPPSMNLSFRTFGTIRVEGGWRNENEKATLDPVKW